MATDTRTVALSCSMLDSHHIFGTKMKNFRGRMTPLRGPPGPWKIVVYLLFCLRPRTACFGCKKARENNRFSKIHGLTSDDNSRLGSSPSVRQSVSLSVCQPVRLSVRQSTKYEAIYCIPVSLQIMSSLSKMSQTPTRTTTTTTKWIIVPSEQALTVKNQV